MKIDASFPFENCTVYLNKNNENRNIVLLMNKETKNRRNMSYARYLMCVKEKRILEKYEQVDHIDEDKTNDNINNLQILLKLENIRKHHRFMNIKPRMVKMTCPNCNNIFNRRIDNSHVQRKHKNYCCCSLKCQHILQSRRLSKEDMIEIGKNQVIEIFR